MFTGIVEAIGTISALDHPSPSTQSKTTTLTITPPPTDPHPFLADAHLGDSIAINGTCLTITALLPDPTPTSFAVTLSPETLRRTNLSSLSVNSRVNLERAVLAGESRMGGHFVQGHVDTVARIVDVRQDGPEARVFRLKPVVSASSSSEDATANAEGEGRWWGEGGIGPYIVEKGYITLDGASLTVTRVVDPLPSPSPSPSTPAAAQDGDGGGWWEVMLIGYTQSKIVMGTKAIGDEVNVEVDMVGKYVEKSVKGFLEGMMMMMGGPEDGKSTGTGTGTGGGGGGGGYLKRMVESIVDERLGGK